MKICYDTHLAAISIKMAFILLCLKVIFLCNWGETNRDLVSTLHAWPMQMGLWTMSPLCLRVLRSLKLTDLKESAIYTWTMKLVDIQDFLHSFI